MLIIYQKKKIKTILFNRDFFKDNFKFCLLKFKRIKAYIFTLFRLLAPSPAILHCNKKPLSPISKIPKSAQATRDCLEIQGKHIFPSQSKVNMLSAGWDSSRMINSKKKKIRVMEGL